MALLEAHGFSVDVPPQRCCGIPRLGVGDLRGAKEMGGRNLASLLPTVREGTDIVFSTTSCGLMLRHEYGPLLNLPGAEELARHLFDICEYLLHLREEGKTDMTFRPNPMKAAYFAPCHLKSLNIGLPALELLRLVPGLDVRLVEAECCELGVYSFRRKFAIAEGDRKAAEAVAGSIEVILCDARLPDADPSTDSRTVLHPIHFATPVVVFAEDPLSRHDLSNDRFSLTFFLLGL